MKKKNLDFYKNYKSQNTIVDLCFLLITEVVSSGIAATPSVIICLKFQPFSRRTLVSSTKPVGITLFFLAKSLKFALHKRRKGVLRDFRGGQQNVYVCLLWGGVKMVPNFVLEVFTRLSIFIFLEIIVAIL